MREGEPLAFLAGKFYIDTCEGRVELFSKLTPWELLNLKSSDILDIPDRLHAEHGISNSFLSEVMNQFTIQTTGKDALERAFGFADKDAQYMVSNTRHYSWPKSAGKYPLHTQTYTTNTHLTQAIAGIGSNNVIGIQVDAEARMDMVDLERRLQKSLDDQRPVLAVVAMIGTTEGTRIRSAC